MTYKDVLFHSGLVGEGESILSNPVSVSPGEFTPVFIDEHLLSLPNDTNAVCRDNIQCRYDYAVTR